MHSDTSLRGDVRSRPDEGETDFSSAPAVAEYTSGDASLARFVSFGFDNFDMRLC